MKRHLSSEKGGVCVYISMSVYMYAYRYMVYYICIQLYSILYIETLCVYIRTYIKNLNPFSRFDLTKIVSVCKFKHPHICKDLMCDSALL